MLRGNRMDLKLIGPTIYLRPVALADAADIVRMRTDPRCDGFLMPTSPDVSLQEKWIENYLQRAATGSEIYFVACSLEDDHVAGAIRADNISATDFHWGSWVAESQGKPGAGVETFFLFMDYFFLQRGLERCHFEVQKGNMGSLRFHPKTGAIQTGENEHEFHFTNTRTAYSQTRPRYLKVLPQPGFHDVLDS